MHGVPHGESACEPPHPGRTPSEYPAGFQRRVPWKKNSPRPIVKMKLPYSACSMQASASEPEWN
jgi:hypothetical protein